MTWLCTTGVSSDELYSWLIGDIRVLELPRIGGSHGPVVPRLRQRARMASESVGDNPAITRPRTAAEFVDWLAGRYPPIEDLRREHVADNDQLLPHVLFGDVTRYAANLARSHGEDTTLDDLLNDLDSALGADRDDDVANLIWVSFIENAQGVPGDEEEALRARLSHYPHLAEALTHYE